MAADDALLAEVRALRRDVDRLTEKLDRIQDREADALLTMLRLARQVDDLRPDHSKLPHRRIAQDILRAADAWKDWLDANGHGGTDVPPPRSNLDPDNPNAVTAITRPGAVGPLPPSRCPS